MIFLAAVLLTLTPPATGVAILLLTRFPPRLRCVLALGHSFLLSALPLIVLGVAGALLAGRAPYPYLMVAGLPSLAVWAMMRRELSEGFVRFEQDYIPNVFWDKILDI